MNSTVAGGLRLRQHRTMADAGAQPSLLEHNDNPANSCPAMDASVRLYPRGYERGYGVERGYGNGGHDPPKEKGRHGENVGRPSESGIYYRNGVIAENRNPGNRHFGLLDYIDRVHDKIKLMMRVVDDPRYSHLAKLTFVELLFGFHNTETDRCDPSAKTVGERLDRHERKIRGAIAELEAGGDLVSRQRARTSSMYEFPKLGFDDRPKTAAHEVDDRPKTACHATHQDTIYVDDRPKTAAKPLLIIDSESSERESARARARETSTAMPEAPPLAADERRPVSVEVIPPSSEWRPTEKERDYARSLGLSEDDIDDEVDKLVEYRVTHPNYPTRTWFQRAADWKKRHPPRKKGAFEIAAEEYHKLRSEVPEPNNKQSTVWISRDDPRWRELSKRHGGSRGCPTDKDGGWWFPQSWLEPMCEAAE